MKISKNTLNILNNFSNINPSIYIEGGNNLAIKKVIRSNSGADVPTGTIFATATLEENFSTPFSIYDLKQFLQIASTFNDPDYEFFERFVVVSEGKQSIKYGFCDKDMLAIPKSNTMPIDKVITEFIMEKGIFDKLKKMSSILKNEDIIIRNKDNNIEFVLTNKEIKNSDFNIIIDKETDEEFEFITTITDFTFLNDDYNVKIIITNGREALLLESVNYPVKYFVALTT